MRYQTNIKYQERDCLQYRASFINLLYPLITTECSTTLGLCYNNKLLLFLFTYDSSAYNYNLFLAHFVAANVPICRLQHDAFVPSLQADHLVTLAVQQTSNPYKDTTRRHLDGH